MLLKVVSDILILTVNYASSLISVEYQADSIMPFFTELLSFSFLNMLRGEEWWPRGLSLVWKQV